MHFTFCNHRLWQLLRWLGFAKKIESLRCRDIVPLGQAKGEVELQLG